MDSVIELFRDILKLILKRKRDLTQSYDKSPYTNRNVKRAKWQHKQLIIISNLKEICPGSCFPMNYLKAAR